MAVLHLSNRISAGDYVEGMEFNPLYECNTIIRGWVTEIKFNDDMKPSKIYLRADDGYNGERGTIIDYDTAYRCNRVHDWKTAIKRKIPVGTVVKHFKDKLYMILGYAEHVDGGRVVIYKALYSPYKTYIREYAEFMSLVDKKKYPNVTQNYRFEEVENIEVN